MIDYIDIHTHRDEKAENTFSLLNIILPCDEIPKSSYFSAGWHPWYIEPFDLPEIKKMLEEVASNENILAIGECGLDRSVKSIFDKQTEVFLVHLNLAKKHNKPLIIHCVKAYSDLLEILKKEKFDGKIVLHNFNGNLNQIDSLLKFKTYFSFGKILLYPNSKLVESVKNIPIERIFIETDNSDFSIKEMYLIASVFLHIQVDELKLQIKQNFIALLGQGLLE